MVNYALYVCPNCEFDWVLYENDPRPRCVYCQNTFDKESYGAFMGYNPPLSRTVQGRDVRREP
jgi:hypothetical protein